MFFVLSRALDKKKKNKTKNKILSPRLPTQNLPSFLFYLI